MIGGRAPHWNLIIWREILREGIVGGFFSK